ncbi:MAG: hypothetical protein ACK5LS_04345 [Propioniciclava sp.]
MTALTGHLRWPHALFVVVTAGWAVVDRISLAASGAASRSTLLIDIWFDPHQLVYALLPLGLMTVLQRIAATASPEALLRASSWVGGREVIRGASFEVMPGEALADRPGFIPTASGRTNLIRLAAIRGVAGVEKC